MAAPRPRAVDLQAAPSLSECHILLAALQGKDARSLSTVQPGDRLGVCGSPARGGSVFAEVCSIAVVTCVFLVRSNNSSLV